MTTLYFVPLSNTNNKIEEKKATFIYRTTEDNPLATNTIVIEIEEIM